MIQAEKKALIKPNRFVESESSARKTETRGEKKGGGG